MVECRRCAPGGSGSRSPVDIGLHKNVVLVSRVLMPKGGISRDEVASLDHLIAQLSCCGHFARTEQQAIPMLSRRAQQSWGPAVRKVLVGRPQPRIGASYGFSRARYCDNRAIAPEHSEARGPSGFLRHQRCHSAHGAAPRPTCRLKPGGPWPNEGHLAHE